ncbi:MAG: glucose-1-phosphate adenylyltransferase [Pirellulaceae bacterium]|nr:glucose-1-phosphate adenylyltransferase [Pirellulaceae bacterium]
MHDVMTLVLGGGRGTRLFPLTKYRAKPAVPLAAKYRLIDIPLSNCINSGLNRVYVLTQFLSVSLHRHIRQTYRFDAFSGGFVELLAAQQTDEAGTDWYQGTADAVRKNLRYIEQPGIKYVLILSGDQLYRMDYRDMMRTHVESGAHATIAALPIDRTAASSFGLMRLDESGRVVGFLEKPTTDDEINMVRMEPAWFDARGVPSQGRECLANMGIYLFNRDTLVDVLTKTTYADFGREVFPAAIRSRHVQVHLFDGYWEDIGTIRAFYEANLSLLQPEPPFQFMAPGAPMYSRARFLPPTMIGGADVRRSLIADGCRIAENAVIQNSIIGVRCVIGSGAVVRNSIVMGADYYESEEQRRENERLGRPPVGIGPGCHVEGAILDKNCRLGRRVRVVNDARVETQNPDSADCLVRDQIPIVVKDAALPDGWRLQQ